MAKAGIHSAGQGLVEYGLVNALIAVLAIGALQYLGGQVSSSLSSTGQAIQNAGSVGPGPSSKPTPPPSDYGTKKSCTAAGFQWVTKPKPAHCV
jgi:Flp pilus assembly pilin Flp